MHANIKREVGETVVALELCRGLCSVNALPGWWSLVCHRHCQAIGEKWSADILLRC